MHHKPRVICKSRGVTECIGAGHAPRIWMQCSGLSHHALNCAAIPRH
jgi:hypothetical protein